MIRATHAHTELRFFADDAAPAMAPYDAACLLVWDTASIVTLRMLSGKVSRKLWVDLLAWLDDAGVKTVRACRADGHHIPLAYEDSDGFLRVDVATLKARFARAAA